MKYQRTIGIILAFIFILNTGCLKDECNEIPPGGVVIEYGLTVNGEPYIFTDPNTLHEYKIRAYEEDITATRVESSGFLFTYQTQIETVEVTTIIVTVNGNKAMSTWVGSYKCNEQCIYKKKLSCGEKSVLNIAMVGATCNAHYCQCLDRGWLEYHCNWRGYRTKIHNIVGNYYVYAYNGLIKDDKEVTLWLIIRWIGNGNPKVNACNKYQDVRIENYLDVNQLGYSLLNEAMNWEITDFVSGEENE